MSDFQISGLDAIVKKLDTLPEAIAKRLVKEGLADAMEVMKAEVEANAPVGATGNLKAAVVVKPKTKQGNVYVNVQIGAGDFQGDQFYAAMVEYGTKNQPPQGFMRRAFETKGETVKNLAIEKITKVIDDAIKGS
jgi:HK97 gp10 family phage protein